MTKQTLTQFTPTVEKRFNQQLNKMYVGQTRLKKQRPILYNVNITENGSIQITNGLVAAQLENTNAQPKHIEGYPNMAKIFEVDPSEINDSVPIYWNDLKILENQLNVIYKQKIDNVKVTINNEGITIEKGKIEVTDTFIKSNITTDLPTDTEHIFKINPRYLHDCLMFFRQLYKEGYYVRIRTDQSNLIKFTYQDMTYCIALIRY